jgi:hypothetical protein
VHSTGVPRWDIGCCILHYVSSSKPPLTDPQSSPVTNVTTAPVQMASLRVSVGMPLEMVHDRTLSRYCVCNHANQWVAMKSTVNKVGQDRTWAVKTF